MDQAKQDREMNARIFYALARSEQSVRELVKSTTGEAVEMKKLKEIKVSRDYRGITCHYAGTDIEWQILVPVEGEVTIEHRNTAKDKAISEIKAVFGPDTEVVIELG